MSPLNSIADIKGVTVLGRGELVSLFLIFTLESNIHYLFSDQNCKSLQRHFPNVLPQINHTQECHRVLERL